MKRWPWERTKRHLLFWIGIGLFIVSLPLATPNFCFCSWKPVLWELLFTAIVCLPTLLLYTYSLAYGLLPLLVRRQFVLFLVGVLILYTNSWFQFDLLLYGLHYVLTHWFAYTPNYSVDTWLFSTNFPGGAFVENTLTAGLFIGTKIFREWEQKQAESQRLEREKLAQELALLKLRLNPDFLFGSLETLHQLTSQQARHGQEVVLKLAHFLRYILYESRADTVPITWEVTAIEQFVFLQRAMHPTGLDVSLSIRGRINNQTIVPLSLFPIVEQMFQYLPIDRSEPAWVSVDLAIDETKLALKVVNGQPTSQPDDTDWLADVKKQLRFYYGEAFDLQVWSEPDAHIVSLTIPFFTPANESAMQPFGTSDYEKASRKVKDK